MPPGRLVGPTNTIMRGWWDQDAESWRTAVRASKLLHWTPPPPPYYRALLDLASTFITDERYELRHELAVIVTQMACEVVVEQTLTPLLKDKSTGKGKRRGRRRGKGEVPRTFNLEGGALSKYTQLTHDCITEQPFWKPFVHHAKLRHKVVHFGARVGEADAKKSLTVATQFVDHVEKVRGGGASMTDPRGPKGK